MRLAEAVRLRLRDVDLQRHVITLRDSAGMVHREFAMPPSLHSLLSTQCTSVLWRWRADSPQSAQPSPVQLLPRQPGPPPALWAMQWLFPSPVAVRHPRTGGLTRQHLHEARFLRDLAAAMARCGLNQKPSAHTLRDAHAAHAPPGDTEQPVSPAPAPTDAPPEPRHVRAYRRRSVHDGVPPVDDDEDGLGSQLGWKGRPPPDGVEEPAARWRVRRVRRVHRVPRPSPSADAARRMDP